MPETKSKFKLRQHIQAAGEQKYSSSQFSEPQFYESKVHQTHGFPSRGDNEKINAAFDHPIVGDEKHSSSYSVMPISNLAFPMSTDPDRSPVKNNIKSVCNEVN